MLIRGLRKKWVSDGIQAGQLISEAAKITGGKGGGRPDFAQGGGGDASKIGQVLESIRTFAASNLDSL